MNSGDNLRVYSSESSFEIEFMALDTMKLILIKSLLSGTCMLRDVVTKTCNLAFELTNELSNPESVTSPVF
jgi:hypothetical protein